MNSRSVHSRRRFAERIRDGELCDHEFILSALVFSILFNIFLYALFVRTGKNRLAMYTNRLEQSTNKLSSIRERYVKHAMHEKKIANIEKQYAEFLEAIPPSDNIPQLIAELSTMVKKTGLNVSDVRYKLLSQNGDFQPLEFTIPISGEYARIRKLIYELESMDRIIRVIGITRIQKVEQQVSMNLQLVTYFRL